MRNLAETTWLQERSSEIIILPLFYLHCCIFRFTSEVLSLILGGGQFYPHLTHKGISFEMLGGWAIATQLVSTWQHQDSK